MLPWLTDRFGNPSGAHLPARRARQAIDEAREEMAVHLGAAPGEVVFTGGGTEADALAIAGVSQRRPGAVVCSAIEHPAVLRPVEVLGGASLPVGGDGVVDVDAVAATVGPDTVLVSLMLVNNEVGTIQPLAEVAGLVREVAPGAVLHTDAVQAFPWLDVADLASSADLVAVSAHKFGGPQGVGALVVREGVDLQPLVLGGGQERGLRGGTQNVAGIVGMAAAAAATVRTRDEVVQQVGALRDRLADGLADALAGVVETGVSDSGPGRRTSKIAGSCHLCFEGIESEELLYLLEKEEVYASAAASCASGAMEPSHVLAAMGVPRALALGSVRLSLGYATTDQEVDDALAAIPPAVARLRSFAGT